MAWSAIRGYKPVRFRTLPLSPMHPTLHLSSPLLRRLETRSSTSMEQSEDSNTLTRSDAHSLYQPSSSKKKKILPKRRARKPRKRLSCEPCRHSKLRCDRQHPCGTYRQRDCVSCCTFYRPNNDPLSTPADEPTPRSPRPPQPDDAAITRSVPSTRDANEDFGPSQGLLSDTQGPDSTCARWDAVLRRPTVDCNDTLSALENLFVPSSIVPANSKENLLQLLPPDSSCEYLISEYFTHFSPLFHILHGPTFEKQYSTFLQDRNNTTFSWLALLFMVCSVTLNAMDPGDPVLADLFAGQPQFNNTVATVHQLRKASLTCLAEDRFWFITTSTPLRRS